MVDLAGNTLDRSQLLREDVDQLRAGRVFLTGITSTVGTEIAGLLSGIGAGVDALVRDPRSTTGLSNRARLIPGDCRRPASYQQALRSSDRVIHIAGLHLASPLIRALAGHGGLKRVVFIGSARIGYPDRMLSAAELRGKRELQAAEEEITSSRLPWTILRPTMIFSPRDRSLSTIRTYLRKRTVFPLPGRGRVVKQPISARDLAVSVISALMSPAAHQKKYDLPGCDVTVREMIETMAQEMDRRVHLLPVPSWPLEIMSLGFRALGITRGHRPLVRYLRWYRQLTVSGEAARVDFNHQPRAFADNIREQLLAVLNSGTAPSGPGSGRG